MLISLELFESVCWLPGLTWPRKSTHKICPKAVWSTLRSSQKAPRNNSIDLSFDVFGTEIYKINSGYITCNKNASAQHKISAAYVIVYGPASEGKSSCSIISNIYCSYAFVFVAFTGARIFGLFNFGGLIAELAFRFLSARRSFSGDDPGGVGRFMEAGAGIILGS